LAGRNNGRRRGDNEHAEGACAGCGCLGRFGCRWPGGQAGRVRNEIAAQIRLHAGKRLSSPALVADGNHARVDGFVGLGVLGSAAIVALGAQVADPIIGLVITLVILRITWQSWRTVSTTDPVEMIEEPRDPD
jgi:hypothetical protein